MQGKEEAGGTGKVRGCCNSPRGMNSFERHPGDKISRTWETGVEVRKGGKRNDSQVLGLGNWVDDWAIL